MAKKQPSKKEDIAYMLFLEKRINSKNYKSYVSEVEFEKTKKQYDKVKLRIKILYE